MLSRFLGLCARCAIARSKRKGHVRHSEQGPRYVYRPSVARNAARRSALRHVVETFFQGSTEQVVAALVSGEVEKLAPEELESISAMIAAARKKGK